MLTQVQTNIFAELLADIILPTAVKNSHRYLCIFAPFGCNGLNRSFSMHYSIYQSTMSLPVYAKEREIYDTIR